MPCLAGEDAGEVLAVRRDVYLFRGAEKTRAKPQSRVLLDDSVETERGARAKLFFTDDSILNLGPMSRLIIREYMAASAQERPKSVMNLMEGSLKVVVGKSELEIHTPTVVAAARGTEFYLKILGSGPTLSTLVVVTKGIVEVRNANLLIKGMQTVYPGQMSQVTSDGPPTTPVPATPEIRSEVTTETQVASIPSTRGDVLVPEVVQAKVRQVRQERPAVQQWTEGNSSRDGTGLAALGPPPITSQVPFEAIGGGKTPMRIRVEW